MTFLAKLGAALALTLAIGLTQAPLAAAIPIVEPARSCTWNGYTYSDGDKIEVRLPDGTTQTYECQHGEWVMVSDFRFWSTPWYPNAARIAP